MASLVACIGRSGRSARLIAAERLGIDRTGDCIFITGEWHGVLGLVDSDGRTRH